MGPFICSCSGARGICWWWWRWAGCGRAADGKVADAVAAAAAAAAAAVLGVNGGRKLPPTAAATAVSHIIRNEV